MCLTSGAMKSWTNSLVKVQKWFISTMKMGQSRSMKHWNIFTLLCGCLSKKSFLNFITMKASRHVW